jgi:cell wall-associated NlpC family hydrolase
MRPLLILLASIFVASGALFLSSCDSTGEGVSTAPHATPPSERRTRPIAFHDLPSTSRGDEIVFYALSLLNTGYRFGGKNPAAGLDCSGMVTYVYRHAAHIDIEGNAASLARQGRPAEMNRLRPGDLVFFNTLRRPFSHVGIYLGGGRFIHSPHRNGRVSISSINNPYFLRRYEAARTFFPLPSKR